ncbi:MAG: S-layer homology domain-containing protein, partial [Nitriliruptoraceae bacterium]
MSVSTILPDAVTPLRASAVAAALLATVWPAGPTLAQEERPTEEDGATEDDGAVEGDSTTEDPREDPAAEVGGEIEFVDTAGLDVADAVDALVEMGVVRGCEEERFCPWEDVTRGQAASMLARALDLEPVADGPFTDIAGSTHEQQINAIHAAGIVNGCEDEEAFCATDPLTREQLATMLARAFELPPTSTTHFDDATEVHGPYVQRLGEAGIAAGCGDPLTHFCSQTPVARVHAATFLARALELMPQVELAPLEERREQQAAIDAEREAERQ